jgi:hypothetical protein
MTPPVAGYRPIETVDRISEEENDGQVKEAAQDLWSLVVIWAGTLNRDHISPSLLL